MKTFLLSGSGVALAIALASTSATAQTTPPTAPPNSDVQNPTPAPQARPSDTDATGAQNDGSVTPDIVVTASKRAENLSDVPMSITAISGDDLKEKGINNVQDLAKLTPGLSYVESGLSVPVYSLRGVGFFDTAIGSRPTVSVYVDEAPLPFSIMTSGAAFDLERVEVLKGPQGTLFGQNATGGAINYIAAKPQDELHAGATASYARFNTADVQGYITGPITSTIDARIAARVVAGDGWQRSYTRDDTLGRQRYTQGRFLLDWKPSSRLKVSVDLNGFIDRGDTQAAQLIGILYVTPSKASDVPLLGTYPLAPADDRAADWNPGTKYQKNNKFYQAVFRGDYELTSAITLTSLTSWSHMNISQLNDADGTAILSSDVMVKGKVSSFSEELRLAGNMGIFRWIVGGNYARDRSIENDYLYFPYASANAAFTPLYTYDFTNPFVTQRFGTYAAFGNADLDLGRFTLHGGLRFTQANLDYTGCTKVNDNTSGAAITTLYNILRGARGLAALPLLQAGQCQSLDATLTPNLRVGKLNENNVSWRAGVDYKPSRDTLLYANVSRGYKAGSLTTPGAINLEEFDPVTQESVLAYEAGYKIALANRKINVSGAGFYYDYTNKQLLARRITTPNLLGALPALINVPKSRIIGAEGQVTVFPVRGLSLTASGTYLDTKVTSDFLNYSILGAQQNFQGERFPYTPKWQVVLDGEYKFPLNDRVSGMVGGNLNYRSSTSAGFGVNNFLKINAYTLLDLRTGIQAPDGKWSVQLFGRNVTNTYYWTNIAKFNDTVRRFAGLPATYGIQASFKY